MYIRMHMCICTYIHTHMHTHVNVGTYVFTYMHLSVIHNKGTFKLYYKVLNSIKLLFSSKFDPNCNFSSLRFQKRVACLCVPHLHAYPSAKSAYLGTLTRWPPLSSLC